MKELIIILNELGACEDAMEWLSSQASLEQAWENCEKGNWLLWLIAMLDVDGRKLSLAKGLIANEEYKHRHMQHVQLQGHELQLFLKKSANIVREIFNFDDIESSLNGKT